MINEEIKSISNEVNLVSDSSKGVTKLTVDEALDMARQEDLDLVCLDVKARPPIVKICDYNKYKYKKNKKIKENKKQAKLNTLGNKEIRLNPYIDNHDLQVKANTISRLLSEHNRVSISLIYKGRNIKNINSGEITLNKLLDMISIKYNLESGIKINGNRLIAIISPDK